MISLKLKFSYFGIILLLCLHFYIIILLYYYHLLFFLIPDLEFHLQVFVVSDLKKETKQGAYYSLFMTLLHCIITIV